MKMAETKYTVEQWVDLFRSIPTAMKLEAGIVRQDILSFLEKNNFQAPEEYIRFLELSNGASLFNGKVQIWKIPTEGEVVPNWKSIVYMNLESVKGEFPDIDGVFLFANNYLGDYIGICTKDKEYDIIYISPETGETWNCYTFTDWLEETWEDMVSGWD